MDVLQREEISKITNLYPGTKDQEVLLGCHFLHYHLKGYVMVVFTLSSLSKSLRLALLRLLLLKRSGESMSRQSAKFKLQQLAKYKVAGLRSGKSLFFYITFQKPNGFVQRKIAVICLARTNRIFLNESVCRTLCTMTTIKSMKYNN